MTVVAIGMIGMGRIERAIGREIGDGVSSIAALVCVKDESVCGAAVVIYDIG